MAKNKNKKMARVKSGAAKGGAATADSSSAGADAGTKKKRVSPLTFLSQVRSEVEKVTWPSRNEWFVTTIMVFIMVTLAAIFFLLVDLILRNVMQALFGIG